MDNKNSLQFDADNLIIRSRKEISRTIWNNFVDSSPSAWLNHTFDMQDAIATWPGKSDFSFALVDADNPNIIRALIPVTSIKTKLLKWMDWNVIESRGGPIFENNIDEVTREKLSGLIFENLGKISKTHNAYEIRFSIEGLAPLFQGENLPRINPLLYLGCEISNGQTWVLDLRKGKSSIWENMEKRARNAARKAEKNGVQIRLAEGIDDLKIYYDLHCQTYQRTGVIPHPKKYFEEIWGNFISNGRSVVFFAEYENEVVAAENFGIYKNSSVYWSGAASPVGLAVQANSLIQWTAIQWMIDNNIDWYEVGEAFPQQKDGKRKGLNDFKKSFGGELFPIFRGRILIRKRYFHLIEFLRSIK